MRIVAYKLIEGGAPDLVFQSDDEATSAGEQYGTAWLDKHGPSRN